MENQEKMTKYSDAFNEMQNQFLRVRNELEKLQQQFLKVNSLSRAMWSDRVSPKFEMEGKFAIVLTKNERDGTYRIDSSMTQEKALALKNENMFLHNTTKCDPESDGPCHFPNTHDFIHELMKLSTELDAK